MTIKINVQTMTAQTLKFASQIHFRQNKLSKIPRFGPKILLITIIKRYMIMALSSDHANI